MQVPLELAQRIICGAIGYADFGRTAGYLGIERDYELTLGRDGEAT